MTRKLFQKAKRRQPRATPGQHSAKQSRPPCSTAKNSAPVPERDPHGATGNITSGGRFVRFDDGLRFVWRDATFTVDNVMREGLRVAIRGGAALRNPYEGRLDGVMSEDERRLAVQRADNWAIGYNLGRQGLIAYAAEVPMLDTTRANVRIVAPPGNIVGTTIITGSELLAAPLTVGKDNHE